jgi:rSAM/selenodomain-associated transferase 2/rSAM/selenodomain-associated transferase 1
VTRISIVVPTLNEAQGVGAALAALAPLRARGHEVIVVDGGSSDGTPALARSAADRVVSAPRGRASQLNAGAALARGDVLLFLHADTRLPADADSLVLCGLAASGRSWGRFDVRIEGASILLPVIAFGMNLRSRTSGIATGDQAMFVRREAFERAGRFPPLELMEDIALSRSLKRLSAPLCLADKASTSGRRWERNGVLRTVLLMWWLRLRFFFGAAPFDLARAYDGAHACRVMVFARAPVPVKVKTRLIPELGEAGASALHRRLVAHCLQAARDSRLGPVELWCAPGVDDPFFRECEQRFGASLHPQKDGDLGARMQGAFESALTRSRRAILVGGDVPALSPAYLRDADHALAAGNDAGVGPAEDGGYVLIGLSRIDPGLFRDITWGGSEVFAQTRGRAAALGLRIHELPRLWDVDRPEDLARLPQTMRAQ